MMHKQQFAEVWSHQPSEEALEAREKINGLSEDDLKKLTALSVEEVHIRVGGSERTVTAQKFMPVGVNKADIDDSRWIVGHNPFPQGYTGLHMSLRWLIAQAAMGGGNNPMIIFPENTFRAPAYDLTKAELELVASGDATPVAELRAAAIEKLIPNDSKKNTIGYSLGGLIVPLFASLTECDYAVSAEAPNTETGRTPAGLRKATSKKAMSLTNRAVMASGVPLLEKVQGVHDGRMAPRQVANLANFAASLVSPVSLAWQKGMAGDRFFDDIKEIPEDTISVVGVGEFSRLFTHEARMRLVGNPAVDAIVDLRDCGHPEGGDNILIFADFCRIATSLQKAA